jgi:quinol monooxygenase YgiN
MTEIGRTIVASLGARPGKRDELREVLEGLAAPAAADGCVDCHLHASDDDPDLVMSHESGRSRKDLDEHLGKPQPAPRDRGDELLAAPVGVRSYATPSPYDR